MHDPLDLYEHAVQSPAELAIFLVAIHGREPTRLREDFGGTGAVARAFLHAAPGRHAMVVDIDPAPLARCRDIPGLRTLAADATRLDDAEPVDIIFVGNFSLGYVEGRRRLARYLESSRRRLAPGGLFACDMYGGPGAWRLGGMARRIPLPDGSILHYWWEHEAADPITGLVRNAISFRIETAGEIVEEHPRAFVYRWRLRSLPELRDLLLEAGFGDIEVRLRTEIEPDGRPSPPASSRELGDDWTALITARA
ncbi:MAG: hypothetical protein WCK33_02695 [Phycisphaerae bacterium]|jgi:SAM-dependent methyltransferase